MPSSARQIMGTRLVTNAQRETGHANRHLQARAGYLRALRHLVTDNSANRISADDGDSGTTG
jgi:hypothetical protein